MRKLCNTYSLTAASLAALGRILRVDLVHREVQGSGIRSWIGLSGSAMANPSKITFAAAVYQVWIERNARMFTSDVRVVLAVTETNVRSRVISRMKFPKNQENVGLCRKWRIPVRILERSTVQSV